jgi:periplasmic protein TonB
MSSLADASPAKSDGLWNLAPAILRPAVGIESSHSSLARSSTAGSILLPIFTTSICLHLLVVGFIGAHLPEDAPRPRALLAPPATRLIEDIKLDSEKIPELPPPSKPDRISQPPLPSAVAQIDLPPLPQVAVIAAIPVDFALRVSGPVRLVTASSKASGSIRAVPSGPQEIDDAHLGRNLLIPSIVYPSEALLHRVSGEVQVEFRTSATGDISDARIRRSSGSGALDWAALENIRHGRWTGEAGYFTKTYVFILY